MEFTDILEQTIALLQHQGRISYGALKRRFGLDDAYLDDLKIELIEAQQLARDENGRILVWIGTSTPIPPPVSDPTPSPAPPVPQGEFPHGERHTPDAERRQLTVLFCDLVDSTALAGQLDPEDLREVIRAYQAACATVIEPLEGHIAQYLGDGLLVYFGYPQAHEDDAQRAVRAGLGMVAAVQALNTQLAQRHGVRIAVRIGIHTGVVVVGEMGGGSRQEQLALGDTPNLAARLQGLAAPDTVVLSAATLRLVQGYFTYQDLGAHTLRGVSASVQVYRILGESGVQSRLEALVPSRLTPLVGREEEVALLQQRWEQARAGQGQVVLLSGEAGIGKSRLVQVLKDHVAYEPHARIEWRGSSYHQQSALYPVIAHLHRLLQWREDETPQEKLRTLETTLAASGLALPETVPLLAALLSLPLPRSLSCPDPDAPTATPEDPGDPADLARGGSAATTSAGDCRRSALDRSLHPGAAESAHRPGSERQTLSDADRPPGVSLAMDHGGASHRAHAAPICPRPGHAPGQPCGGRQDLTSCRAGGSRAQDRRCAAVRGRTDQSGAGVGSTPGAGGPLRLAGPLPPLAIPATLHDALMARLDRLAAAKLRGATGRGYRAHLRL